MQMAGRKWVIGLGVLFVIVVAWWFMGPRPYQLVYRGHEFEYLEPAGASTNRAAVLRVWLGYKGVRPRWWGQRVESKIEDGHDWSFSNGPNVQGGGGWPPAARYDEKEDNYRYDLEKGLTVYQVENGKIISTAAGDATQCRLIISFRDPQKRAIVKIPLTLPLKDGDGKVVNALNESEEES